MRLFVAVELPEQVKDNLEITACALGKKAVSGNFSRQENYHLTLTFIGETIHLDQAKAAVETIVQPPFSFTVKDMGQFRRKDGGIVWAGVEHSEPLVRLAHEVQAALTKQGFALEDREFRPHLTLGRSVVLEKPFRSEDWNHLIPSMECPVRRVLLMKSERIDGRLTYTPVLIKTL